MSGNNVKKKVILNFPYFLIGAVVTNLGEAWRLAEGTNMSQKVQSIVLEGIIGKAFANPLPSIRPLDLMVGVAVGAGLRLAVYLKGKNAKKFRHNQEYGSARWGTHADVEPFEDSDFRNNVILSQTERLTMNGRPSNPKYARNKNVLCVGGSGVGQDSFLYQTQYLADALILCCYGSERLHFGRTVIKSP